MKEVVEWQWEFGGWLAPLGGPAAWALLGAALLLSVGLAWVSYRRSLRQLTLGWRIGLVGLRALALTLLLFCLANPVRTTRTLLEETGTRQIAVVADRSDSMTKPDARGRSRLEDAAEKWRTAWRRVQDGPQPESYVFHRSLVPVADFDEAVSSGPGGADATRLFGSLEELLTGSKPGSTAAIVCLTDGLDTTGESPERLIAAARAAQIPLYFVPGRNTLRPEAALSIRHFNVPSATLPNSTLAVRAVIESYSADPRKVPVRLLRGGRVVAEARLDLPRGESLQLWEAEIDTGAPGTMELELQVGEAGERTARHVATAVAERLETKVLFFQGALDWGFRFYRNALAEDGGFEVTALFSPDVGVRLATGGEGAPTDLPATAAGLAKYHLVVLSNVERRQLSEPQQQALLGYVRAGGGLLFILPDTRAAGGFAGSELETMLPVAFGRAAPELPLDRQARLFQEQMRGRADPRPEVLFAEAMTARPVEVPLREFEIRESSLAKLFTAGSGAVVPKFSVNAVVRQVKAGAEVLAASREAGKPEPLLVAQTFGRGRVTVMTTDMLWRWSLSEPSEAQTARSFWQQLTVWLAQPVVGGLRFLDAFGEVTAGAEVAVRLQSDADAAPEVDLIAPDGTHTPLAVLSKGDGRYEVRAKPETPGGWGLIASDVKGGSARASLQAVAAEPVRESQVRPPDLTRLRAIAAATGGALLGSMAPESRSGSRSAAPPLMLAERRTSLWNRWPVLALLLGLYGAELALRRKARLL